MESMRTNHSNTLKGKTYEEIHGKKKAKELKDSRSKTTKGRKRSLETRKKLSSMAKQRTGDKNHFFGKRHTRETREKMSAIRREMFKERQAVNKQVRRYWKVAEWTRNIFERDGWCCQLCGIKNHMGLGRTVKLEAHHKNELHNIIGDKPFDVVIVLPELYDLNNGITLCRPCHKKVHGWKGLDE